MARCHDLVIFAIVEICGRLYRLNYHSLAFGYARSGCGKNKDSPACAKVMSLAAIEQTLRKAVPAEQLREWMRPRPLRVLSDLLIAWAIILAVPPLLGSLHSWVAYIPAAILIGLAQYALFILGHDGIHGCLSTNRRINDEVARWLIYAPMCMGFEDGRHNHLEHHKKLGTSEDPDRYIHILSNKNSPIDFIFFCSGLATFWKTVLKVTPLGVVFSRPAQTAPAVECSAVEDNDSAVTSGKVSTSSLLIKFAQKRLGVFVWQPLIVLYLCLCGLPWWSYFLLWIAPIYFFVFVPDEIRAFCDHAVPDVPDDDVDHQRLVSFLPSRIERIFFSPHLMNLHAEHHLWPGVPYYNRHQVTEFLKTVPEITYRTSYVSFLLELFRILPLGKEDPNSVVKR